MTSCCVYNRELDLSLKEIVDILDDPDYDLAEALIQHKSALLDRKKRISTLLQTIDATINNLKKGEIMKNPEELYSGFPKETGTTYRKEAVEKYGKEVIEQSEQALMKLGKGGFETLIQEAANIFKELYDLRKKDPKDGKVQQLIARHYSVIRKLWGTENSGDRQACAYAGLGDLYVSDERYLANVINENPQSEFADFLRNAMKYFAENKLS